VPQSKTTPSSPASSPCLCTLWTKTRQRHQADPPDTLAGRQLLSPTCHTAVAALLNGAGEREVKKLNLLTPPVFWCLGDGPTMHEEGALPGTPGRRVRALPMTDPVVRGPSHWRRESAGPPFSRLSRPGEHLTHQPLLVPLRRPKPRPTIHKHLTEHAAVARATAGKVLASRCARQGQSTRRGMISPPVKCSTSTTWYLYRAAGSSSSSSCVRGYQPRPSRPSWP